MKIIKLIVIFSTLVFSIQGISSDDMNQNEGKYSLIVGKPYKVKYLRQIPESDQVIIGAKYVAYFKDYELVYGSLKKKRVLKVELQASDDLTIGYFEEIFVVVEDSNKKLLQGVTWDVPAYNICLPSENVSDFGMDNGFGKYIPRNGKKCISLYNHGK